MKTEIQTFTNEMFGKIRTCQVDNQIMFVGIDVAKALGYSNTRDALRKHVDTEDKGTVAIRDTAYETRAVVINESGLYALILSSNLPQAKAFKRWVTSEVLPQIRQTGGYIPTHDADGRDLSAEEILQRADAIVGATLRQINAEAEDTLTATQVAKTFNMKPADFNAVLSHMGIQYRAHGRWNLSEHLEGRGLTSLRTHLGYSLKGKRKVRVYMTWTMAGLHYLNSKLGYPNL